MKNLSQNFVLISLLLTNIWHFSYSRTHSAANIAFADLPTFDDENTEIHSLLQNASFTEESIFNTTLATTSLAPIYVTTDNVPVPENCTTDDEAEINQILLDKIMPTYKKQVLPNNTKGVETRVEIHINAIPHFSELDSFFELDLFFSELWHEPRLSFRHLPQATCVKNVTLDLEYLQRVWTPNVCIVNSKAAEIHSSPSENVFLILYQDGTLWKNCRMLVRGPCEIGIGV